VLAVRDSVVKAFWNQRDPVATATAARARTDTRFERT
jgi:hypothetical protein